MLGVECDGITILSCISGVVSFRAEKRRGFYIKTPSLVSVSVSFSHRCPKVYHRPTFAVKERGRDCRAVAAPRLDTIPGIELDAVDTAVAIFDAIE